MAAAEGCEIVPYEARFRADVLRLRESLDAFQPGWNAVEFEWRHEQNPYLGDPRITLALHEGRVVGMRALYGARWEAGHDGHSFLAPCLGGTVIERGHRARGLFARLTRALEADLAAQGIRYAFNFSAGPVTQLASRALGWRGVGPLVTWSRTPTGWERAGWSWRAVRTLSRIAARARIAASPVTLAQAPRASEMAELVSECPWDGRLRHVRDETYLLWRFRNPASQYRFLYLRRGGRLAGYLVARHPRGGWRLDVVDWASRDPGVALALFAAVIRYAESRSMPLCVWRDSLPDVAAAFLAEAGLREVEEAAPFRGYQAALLLKRIGSEDDPREWSVDGFPIDRLEGWDLRMVYSDAF